MTALLRAPLVGGLLLALGSLLGGAFSLSSLGRDIAAMSVTLVVLVVIFHGVCFLRRGLLLFVLNRSRQELVSRFLGAAAVLGWPSFLVAESVLAGSRRIGGPTSIGLFTVAIAAFAGLVVVVSEVEWVGQRRRILAALCGLSAVLCSVANHSLYAAQYPAAHLSLAVIAVGSAAFCPVPSQWAKILRPLGAGVFVIVLVACVFLPPSFLPRSPGERIFAATRGLLGGGADSGNADAEIFSRRLGPQRTENLEDVLQGMGATQPRRILWITIDALRNDRCGFGGYDGDNTPNMDRLAESSTVFDRCYSQGSDSLGSILSSFSGRYPAALNFRRMAEGLAPVEQQNIAETLRNRGFTTIGIPAYEADLLRGTFLPFRRGFQEWTLPKGHGQRPAGECVRLASEALVSTRGRNAFIWLHFMEVHGPYPNQSGPFGNNPSKQYDDALRMVDETLGEFFEKARAGGDLDDTLVLIHGDHGEEFGEHGGRYHGSTLFEESIRVPLLIHLPGQQSGRHVEGVTGLVNVAPTLLDCLGVGSPTPLQGESLLPVMAGTGTMAGFALAQLATPFGGRWSAVIDGQHKAIQNDRTGDAAFFDLDTDPDENDPSGESLSREEIDQLRHQLVSAMAFARAVPDSKPFVAPEPAGNIELKPAIDPFSSLPKRDPKFRENHKELFEGSTASRRAVLSAMPLLPRGAAARELLLMGNKDVQLWMYANLLDRDLSDSWATALLLMLAEADDPLLIPLFNWRRHLNPELSRVESLVFNRLAVDPQLPGGAQFLTKVARTQGVQARADALHLMHRIGAIHRLMDKWWDAGVSVANEVVEWEKWSIESVSHRSRSASEDAEILVIRAVDSASSGQSIGDPVRLQAIFLDKANKAIMKAMVYGVVDYKGRVILGVRSPASAWHQLRLVGSKGHALPVIDTEGL